MPQGRRSFAQSNLGVTALAVFGQILDREPPLSSVAAEAAQELPVSHAP